VYKNQFPSYHVVCLPMLQRLHVESNTKNVTLVFNDSSNQVRMEDSGDQDEDNLQHSFSQVS
jgi:hypothetical protein